MKKKKFISPKNKKKYSISRNFNRFFRRQFSTKYKPLNLLSFVKRFHFFNLTAGYSMLALLGFKQHMKLNILDRYRDHRKIIRKMMVLKFYFDYAFVKKEKFELLKSLVIFKSFRLHFSLPLRGQRTKTNAKTRKKYDKL